MDKKDRLFIKICGYNDQENQIEKYWSPRRARRARKKLKRKVFLPPPITLESAAVTFVSVYA